MKAQICAVDADNEAGHLDGGRWTTVESDTITVTKCDDKLLIGAECSEVVGSGARGGSMKRINRRAIIYLTPTEIQMIVESAIRAGFAPLARSKRVATAMKQLDEAVTELGVDVRQKQV